MTLVWSSSAGALTLQSPTANDPLLDMNTQPSLDLQFAASKTLDDRVSGDNLITFSRASSATYVDSNGVIQTAAIDAPRFDHDPSTGESLGLLVEESRTNIQIYSQDFDNAAWSKVASSITANTTTAPDGTATADTLTGDGSGSTSKYIESSIDATADVFWQQTCYFKKGTNDFVQMAVGGISNIYANFDLNNGTVGSYGSNSLMLTPTITRIGSSGWYRCTLAFDLTVGSNKNPVPVFALVPSASSARLETNSLSTNVYLWGAQVEEGSFPTSYIPTAGSTVTRAADTAEITGTNFSGWYNQSEGTLFTDVARINTGDNITWIAIDDGTTANRVRSLFRADDKHRSIIASSGVSVFDSTITSPSTKEAFALQENNSMLSVGGDLGSLDTSVVLPVADRLTLFSTSFHISRLTYYPYRLGDTKLQEITS